MTTAAKRAQIIVDAFSVVCPHCGAEQPNQDGSEMWTPDDLKKTEPRRQCVSCDEPIIIDRGPKSARFCW